MLHRYKSVLTKTFTFTFVGAVFIILGPKNVLKSPNNIVPSNFSLVIVLFLLLYVVTSFLASLTEQLLCVLGCLVLFTLNIKYAYFIKI